VWLILGRANVMCVFCHVAGIQERGLDICELHKSQSKRTHSRGGIE